MLRSEGTPLGLSTVYRVLHEVRATIPAPLQVRFEGVAGEFAQFDFGEVSVRLPEDKRRTVHFAAYRLKYSRWIHVVLVPNERVEALIRSLLDSFAASGGVPLRVVFDNPKTVVVRHEEGRPVWNPVLGPVAIDYGFTIELCTPRQPQQKGRGRESRRLCEARLLPRAALHRPHDRSAAATRRVAGRGEHDAAESRDEGDSHRAARGGAGAHETARGGAE